MPRTDKTPDGQPRGLDAAVAERVGRVLGRPIEFHWCASPDCSWHCLPEGRCDVVADLARPYPVPIICALLGAPREDWQRFSSWADDIFQAFSITADIRAVEPVVMRAWGELDEYVDDMRRLYGIEVSR